MTAMLRWAAMGKRRDSRGAETLCHMLHSSRPMAVPSSDGMVLAAWRARAAVLLVQLQRRGAEAAVCIRLFVLTLGKSRKATW